MIICVQLLKKKLEMLYKIYKYKVFQKNEEKEDC